MPSETKIRYPETPRDKHVDIIHDTAIPDPYRWLEDIDSEPTQAWIEAQNALTHSYLRQFPQRESIQERVTQLWNYEKYGIPFKRAGRYFFTRNDGLQNQAVLYWMESLDGKPKELIDPNTLSDDGTVALAGYSVSEDGRLIAYSLSSAGSDWQEWHVRSIDTGEDLEDHLKWSKFSGASWTQDGQGFFYSRYDEPQDESAYKGANYFQKLCYHRIGTPQSEDTLVYERPDQKEWGFSGRVTEDGRYLVISVWQGTHRENGVFYQDLSGNGSVVELLNNFDAAYSYIGNEGSRFYFSTDLDAPLSKVIAIDLRSPARADWTTIIEESDDALQGVSFVGGRLVASYLHDAHSCVRIFGTSGERVTEVELPGMGTVLGFGGRSTDSETFYSFTGFTTPGTIYQYDLTTNQSTMFRQPQVDFNADAYVTEQVFYESRDGTRIPMFLTYKQGMERNGQNPTYLYGYGGFDISLTPAFSISNLVWMEMGGIYAQANLRGGGEYGKAWHDAGRLRNKQNVFDDFIAAAEWLITNRYTSTPKLAIGGGSNGGLLVGACLTQRPDLFGCGLLAVGVLDMLRFHKFTIGWAWTSDYGSPDEIDDFQVLLAYSPYHNIQAATSYPPTLVLTGDHDDRVFPAHSFKFGAALQAAQAGDAPILVRIETRAGHGAGKPTAKLIAEIADRWAFLCHALAV